MKFVEIDGKPMSAEPGASKEPPRPQTSGFPGGAVGHTVAARELSFPESHTKRLHHISLSSVNKHIWALQNYLSFDLQGSIVQTIVASSETRPQSSKTMASRSRYDHLMLVPR